MAKRKCYFQCIYDGQLYGFPPPSYKNYEKFSKWKNVLRKIDQEKNDLFIAHNIKLCGSHFEKHFITSNNRLTRHAVPSLNLGLNRKQEYLLCSFIERNSKLIMHNHLQGESLDLLRAVWKIITPKLNSLGPMKSYSGWTKYLNDVMANLKSKEVKWKKEDDAMVVKNCDDFTELELKILHLWNNKGKESDIQDLFESNFSDENDIDMEFALEVDEDEGNTDSNIDSNLHSNIDGDIDSRHIDGDIDSHIDGNIDSNIDGNIDSHIDCHTETRKEIITYSLYVETGGHTPLLQAADIARCKGPNNTNIMCKCKHSDAEFEDEFEAFGMEIAHELRNMPPEIASETQRQLMSILRKRQRKLINDSFL